MNQFQLGQLVVMSHPHGGLTLPCRVVELRKDQVRVESDHLTNWTAWWPIDQISKWAHSEQTQLQDNRDKKSPDSLDV